MTALAGVWAEALKWATDAPVAVDAGGGGWEWSAPVIVAVVAAVIAAASLATTFYVGRKSVEAARDAVAVAMRQTELQDDAARAAIAESKRATQVAIEQTDLQRGIALRAQKPEVWAALRPQPYGPGLLKLYAGNSGNSVARNVRISIDLKVEPGEDPGIEALSASARRFDLMSLVPGGTHEWHPELDFTPQDPEEPPLHRLSVTWEDERGNPDGISYDISISDAWTSSRTWDGTQALIDAIAELRG